MILGTRLDPPAWIVVKGAHPDDGTRSCTPITSTPTISLRALNPQECRPPLRCARNRGSTQGAHMRKRLLRRSRFHVRNLAFRHSASRSRKAVTIKVSFAIVAYTTRECVRLHRPASYKRFQSLFSWVRNLTIRVGYGGFDPSFGYSPFNEWAVCMPGIFDGHFPSQR
jgi:hypothetical protein